MKEKLRVLQVIPKLNISGAEQGCFDVANFLVKNNLLSYIATSSGYRIEQLEKNGSTVIKIPVHSKNPFTIILNIFRISAIIRKHKINLIHARSRAPAWSSYFAAKLTNIKFVTTFHGTYNFNNFIKKFYNSIMLRSDHVIAISEFIFSEIKNKYAFVNKNISVVARGIDASTLNPLHVSINEIDKFIEGQSLRKKSIKIVLPGRITGWKGHKIAIEAMSYLKKNIENDFELILVGPTDNIRLKKNLTEMITNYALENNIKFTGPSKKMSMIYSLADIVLSCATDPEAFGRIPVEAQAMGKTIIASNHGGHKETIIEGMSGFLYSPLNAQELARTIQNVISSDLYKSEKIKNKRRKFILENFTDEVMCLKTLNIYQQVLDIE